MPGQPFKNSDLRIQKNEFAIHDMLSKLITLYSHIDSYKQKHGSLPDKNYMLSELNRRGILITKVRKLEQYLQFIASIKDKMEALSRQYRLAYELSDEVPVDIKDVLKDISSYFAESPES